MVTANLGEMGINKLTYGQNRFNTRRVGNSIHHIRLVLRLSVIYCRFNVTTGIAMMGTYHSPNSIYLSINPSILTTIYLSIHSYSYLSIHPFLQLSIYPSVSSFMYKFIHLSISRSVYSSTHLSINPHLPPIINQY